jgi:hypothetical protein
MRPRGDTGGGTRRIRTRLVGVLVTAAALLAVPASAQALTVSAFSAQPASLDAGANTDFTIDMQFGDAGDQVKDVRISLPPGLVANPSAPPQCTVEQLNTNSCPPGSDVGDVTTNVLLLGIGSSTVTGNIYNVVPQPGEPARLGIVLTPPLGGVLLQNIVIQSGAELRPSDLGLDSVIKDSPRTAKTTLPAPLDEVPVDITREIVTLKGEVNGQPFARIPTSCSEATTTVTVNSYASPGTFADGSDSFTPENCGSLDFSPSFSAVVGGAVGSQKTTATTSIDQDPGEAGLIKATVTIPPDLNPDANLLGNRCSPIAFLASNCPPNSVMGSAIAASPLLKQPLSGNVMLIDTGGLPDIGLDLQGQLHLLLRGTLGVDKVVTFDNLPDIPIAHFALTFPSAPGLLTASRNLCVPPAPNFHADFQGYNGASSSVDSAATVVGACNPLGTKKCKKAKKRKRNHRAAEAKKKHKKKSCKKKRKHKKRH